MESPNYRPAFKISLSIQLINVEADCVVFYNSFKRQDWSKVLAGPGALEKLYGHFPNPPRGLHFSFFTCEYAQMLRIESCATS